ncbi:MAG: dTDP-4-dehydrorhamnose reductase [Rhodospirillales bacterium]|nr:dTDP-4-dehydrorhamnose reductase [Rhodospirillales bacterium]
MAGDGRLPILAPLELWGGHECTVNRVGDSFFDQSIASRHDGRADDIDRFASLGISRLRYPVLWERTSPVSPEITDWTLSDGPLRRLRELNVSPIVGLLHHGSGPAYTDLLSEDFAPGLAKHAESVAQRYPWVADWTPVNEPLTTARFSALYGHWHPHSNDEAAFWRAFLNELDAVRLSMRAVRRINAGAHLIQTEDLGKTFSTDPMAGQAAFDNLRRWSTWDFLCGRVTPDHPLWQRLDRFGLGDRVKAIADAPCPPDIIGVNHYLTSDRFLDHRITRYPNEKRGRNWYGAVADLEAVRVLAPRQGGLANALREVWTRYRTPVAITEVHNGCTREEQMRWMAEAWSTAEALRAEQMDIRAVTAWSLLGSFDWNSLLTRSDLSYECGVFDVRSNPPRPTAMVPLLQDLAWGKGERHPVLANSGWWHRDQRLQYRGVTLSAAIGAVPAFSSRSSAPLLIAGATGTLGRAFAHECERRSIDYLLTDRTQLPLNNGEVIDRLLSEVRPWAVINAAGWVKVDEAESSDAECLKANRDGCLTLAQCCAAHDIPFTTFSSDLVFSGDAGRAYIEPDEAFPLNVYGRSKAEADGELLSANSSVLVIRTAAFFSARDTHNFAMQLVDTLRAAETFFAADCKVSPTFVPDLVSTTLDLIIDKEVGLWHLANEGGATWAEFARDVAVAVGLPPALVTEVPLARMPWRARRPICSSLSTVRGQILPTLERAIWTFAAELKR